MMIEVDSVCPECKNTNTVPFSTVADQLTLAEQDAEKDPNDKDLKNEIEFLKAKKNKNSICDEILIEMPIACSHANCKCEYTIRDSDNWDEIKLKLGI